MKDKHDQDTPDMFIDTFTIGDKLNIHRKAREAAEKIMEKGLPVSRIFKQELPLEIPDKDIHAEGYDENCMVIKGYN